MSIEGRNQRLLYTPMFWPNSCKASAWNNALDSRHAWAEAGALWGIIKCNHTMSRSSDVGASRKILGSRKDNPSHCSQLNRRLIELVECCSSAVCRIKLCLFHQSQLLDAVFGVLPKKLIYNNVIERIRPTILCCEVYIECSRYSWEERLKLLERRYHRFVDLGTQRLSWY
jgi:hypothetical protein